MITIALIPGDGVGPEVLAGPIEIVEWLADRGEVACTGPWPAGASALRQHGELLPSMTVGACDEADAILLGAIGDHPGVHAPGLRPELALIGLRERYDLRVSVRQVWRRGRDPLTFVRNLLAGAYGGTATREESDGTGAASDLLHLQPDRIRELADIAVEYVKRSPGAELLSVDKANLLATSRLWRRVVGEVADANDMPVRHVYVDRMAYELGGRDLPDAVVVTEGLFGDILSDLASARAGSIALCGSASIHPGEPKTGRCVGLFEPVHGSAPLHVGADRVDPAGGYLALAALLEWFPSTAKWAPAVRDALAFALTSGPVTYDLAAPGEPVASTSELSRRVTDEFLRLVT